MSIMQGMKCGQMQGMMCAQTQGMMGQDAMKAKMPMMQGQSKEPMMKR